eukprot:COSAG02_NODE_3794_length_6218_cov_8.112273_3_plen_631_part_00
MQKRESMATSRGRKSVGGGASRKSMAPSGRKSVGGRKSMAQGGRRSIIGDEVPRRMTDPRPIKDKKFQTQATMSVVRYLAENSAWSRLLRICCPAPALASVASLGSPSVVCRRSPDSTDYDHTISTKILNNPTTKDFQRVFEFLVSQFDPYRTPKERLQDDVVTAMGQLGYPLSISKSALQAVGTPHTWPNLLAVLVWAVELLEYGKDAHEEMDEFASHDMEKFLFAFLPRAYKNYLSDAYDESAQDEEMEAHFEMRNSSCTEEIQQLEEDNAAMREEIELLQAEVDEIKEMDAKRDEMQRDVASLERYIESQENHKGKMECQLEKQQAEAEDAQTELKRAEAEKQQYRQKLGQQEMSIGDVQRLQHDKVTMDENLQRIQDEKEAMEKELWDLEMATKAATDELEENVKTYQKRAEQLKIVPAGAKLADGVDVSIKFNRLASVVDGMVDKDLKHDIKPKLGDFKMKLVDKCHAIEDDKFAAEEKLHEITSAITDHRDAIAQVSENLQSAEKSLEQEKELWTAKKRAVTKEVTDVDDRLHSLKTEDESSLAQSQHKVETIHAEFQATKQRFESEKEMMNEALLSLTFDLTDHRDYIQQNLQKMSEKAEGVLREVELEDEEDAEDTGQAYAE